MEEEWRQIKEFPDYAVSNLGRVKRITPTFYRPKGNHLLSLKPGKNGYVVIQLFKNKKSRKRLVHHLVLEAFHSNRPTGKECNHIDSNPSNNKIINLEWVTSSANKIHSYKTNNHKKSSSKGEQITTSKLKEGEVYLIRKLLRSGKFTQKFIGKMFHITQAQVSNIRRNLQWKHIIYP